jgi:hypothetical protein
MRHTTVLFALLLTAIIGSSCGISKSINQSNDYPPTFTTSGRSSIMLQKDTLPIIVVLDHPAEKFESALVQTLTDSLRLYGIEAKIEVYGPLSLQLIEHERPRIEQFEKPYLWIQSNESHYLTDQLLDINTASVYNVRLCDKKKIIWRAESRILVSNGRFPHNRDGKPANRMVVNLLHFMRKDGVLNTYPDAIR